MLILTRKLGEVISIGDDITIKVVSIKGRQVKLGIDAPMSMQVHRGEIYEMIKDENKKAAGVKKELVDQIISKLAK